MSEKPAKWVTSRLQCALEATQAGDEERAKGILRRLLADIDEHGIYNSWVPSSLLDLPPYFPYVPKKDSVESE